MLNIERWESIDPNAAETPGDQNFRALADVWRDSNDAEQYDEQLLLLRKSLVYMHEVAKDDSRVETSGAESVLSGPTIWLHRIDQIL